MPNTYFTSDLHLNHTNIIKYCNRPFKTIEEMDTTLINNWNEIVKPKDSIYILGDFTFNNIEYINHTLNILNGKKYLIKGNHDAFLKNKKLDLSQFEWIKDYYTLKTQYKGEKIKLILSHFPFYTWDSKHYGSYHLYGHVHNSTTNLHTIIGNNSYNVGVDVNDFKPISLEQIIINIKRRNLNDYQ